MSSKKWQTRLGLSGCKQRYRGSTIDQEVDILYLRGFFRPCQIDPEWDSEIWDKGRMNVATRSTDLPQSLVYTTAILEEVQKMPPADRNTESYGWLCWCHLISVQQKNQKYV